MVTFRPPGSRSKSLWVSRGVKGRLRVDKRTGFRCGFCGEPANLDEEILHIPGCRREIFPPYNQAIPAPRPVTYTVADFLVIYDKAYRQWRP